MMETIQVKSHATGQERPAPGRIRAVDSPISGPETQLGPSDKAKRIAHYPLDISLPFERYDHRRITAKDIIVHRIMDRIMNPGRGKADHPYLLAKWRDYLRVELPKISDEYLPRETKREERLLRKLLFTTSHSNRETSVERRVHPPRKRKTKESSAAVGLIAESDVLDLIQRYYLETDDSALRLWIDRVKPPRHLGWGGAWRFYSRADEHTRGSVVQAFRLMVQIQNLSTEKYIHDNDCAYLHVLRNRTSSQDRYALYDGGSFLPSLRQPLDRDANGERGSRPSLVNLPWTLGSSESGNSQLAATLDSWTVTRHIFPQEPCEPALLPSDLITPASGPQLVCSQLDITLSTGRGRNTKSKWVTGAAGQTAGGEEFSPLPWPVGLRHSSEPPPGSLIFTHLPPQAHERMTVAAEFVFKSMKLSQLDRRSRRRSLSRSHIAAMFDWDVRLPHKPDLQFTARKHIQSAEIPLNTKSRHFGSQSSNTARRCANCGEVGHSIKACARPCGHCGAPNPTRYPLRTRAHMPFLPVTFRGAPQLVSFGARQNGLQARASRQRHGAHGPEHKPFIPPKATGKHGNPHLAPDCPLPRASRCRCVPFPTYHSAERCHVRCARCQMIRGPEAAPPPLLPPRGSFAHRNAMMCRARCCMCGLPGHSGKECRLRTCRCGVPGHLGQDCRWKVECRASGCMRFLCGLHCQECGKSRHGEGNGSELLVNGKCAVCRGYNGEGLETVEQIVHAPMRVNKDRRSGKRKHRGGQAPEGTKEPSAAMMAEEQGLAKARQVVIKGKQRDT